MNGALLSALEIILGLLLIGFVLLQVKGTGLGSAFGGDMAFYGTKRGAEKILFVATIVVAILFLVVSLVSVIF